MEMKLPCPASHVIQLYFKNFNDHAQHDITDVSRDLTFCKSGAIID